MHLSPFLVAPGAAHTPWTQNWGRQVSKAAALAEASRSDPSVLMAGLSNYLSESQKQELVSAEAREGLEPTECGVPFMAIPGTVTKSA